MTSPSAVPSPPLRKPSLRARMARHIVMPLAASWVVGTAISVAVADHFAQLAFDRSLLDDAYLVASNLEVGNGVLNLALSQGQINAVLFDQSETMYFSVLSEDGSLVAGLAGLDTSVFRSDNALEFADMSYQGRHLRAVRLRRDEPLPGSVIVAQTDATRTRLLHHLLLFSILPQPFLLALLVWWLRRKIRHDLQPLADLQQMLDTRDANDLAPMLPSLAPVATSRDIEHLGQAIDALLARLAQSLHQQREFAGNVAHELRTPLAGIRASATYGLAAPDPGVWRSELQAILESEGRASHRVDQLLALALADESGGHLQLEPLPLADVVRDLVLRVMPRADQAGVDLGASGLDAPVTVTANRALIEGLLDNLIDNALRYGRPPSGRASITVVLERDADRTVALCVIDNGPGLDQATRAAVQARWSQGSAGLALGEGVGLGLAIVARYAELLGAGFALEPAPDGGLSAVVRFKPGADTPPVTVR